MSWTRLWGLWTIGSSTLLFLLMGVDKHQARCDGWRVPEITLHGVELLGGWAGGLLGSAAWAHKRRKPSYFLVQWAISALHVVLWLRLLFL
jgi:uncharacterized membrane protein YsdA (DUF1294 family)